MIAADTAGHRRVAGAGRVLSGRTARLLIGLVGIFVGLVSLRTSEASLGFSYLTESAITAIVELIAGWGLVAVGLETVRRARRPRLGYVLAVAGIAWFLPEWSDPAVGVPTAFTVGLAFAWLYPAVVGHALFAIGGTARPAHLDRFVAIGYVLFGAGLGIVPALGFDPRAVGCGFCPSNLIEIGDVPALVDGSTRVATGLAVAWSAIVVLVLAARLAAPGPGSRSVRATTLVPGVGFFVLVAIALGRTLVQPVPATDETDHLLRLGQSIALVALALGVASEWFRAWQSRARVARVVADLAESPPIGGLRDHLARILRDSELELAYPIGNGQLVDFRGRPVDSWSARPGRRTTPIIRAGSMVALIEHDADVLQASDEVDEVVAAARLGLEHERLQANARAQLDALRAARRRIVEAGDDHRRQLERDLHDGAQQQLIALSIALRFVDRDPETGGWIDDATAELRLAMDDLRGVAHGIYPAVLGDEGFASAVDALAEASTVPLTIEEMVEERFHAAIEVAAYHVVADAVRGGRGPLRLRARRTEAQLVVEVTAQHIPEDVAEEIADRVGAVDGSLERSRNDDGSITLFAEMPMIRAGDDGALHGRDGSFRPDPPHPFR
jgi:signal transduction histidine kinase